MSKKELRARKRRRENARDIQNCPTPSKTGFETQERAIENMIRHGHAGKGQGVYLCRCGTWHRTSRTGSTMIRQFSPTG